MPTTHRALPIAAAVLAGAPGALAAPTTTIAGGILEWTDRAGTVHSAGRIGYELWDADTASDDDLLQTGYTGTNGQISLITNEEDGVLDSTFEVYAIIKAAGQFVGSATDTAGNAHSVRVPNNSWWDVPIGANPGTIGAITLDNGDAVGRLVGVFQAADFNMNYFRSKNLSVPNITIKYDATITGSSYGGGVLNLSYTAWDDWDVVFHELGHHIAENNSFDYRDPVTKAATWAGAHTPGFDHISGGNDNGYSYGADKGTRLAWGEGVATTLGMLAIRDGNLGGAIPGLPAKDLDTAYHSNNLGGAGVTRVLDSQIGDGTSIETKTTAYGGIYRGEGDEWSVQSALWDFYDDTPNENYAPNFALNRNDGVKMGADRLLENLSNADNFRDFWGTLSVTASSPTFKSEALGLAANAKTEQALATLGEVLEWHQISAFPLTADLVFDEKPALQFWEQNYGHSDVFRVLLYDNNWNFLEMSPNIVDTDNIQFTATFSYTLNTALIRNATYHWLVASTSILDNAAPLEDVSRWYWSGANDIRWGDAPAPSTLALAPVALWTATRRRRA